MHDRSSMETATEWVNTKQMCERLKVSRSTLYRVRSRGDILVEGIHYIRKNPAAMFGTSHILWHADDTARAFSRVL